MNGEIIFTDCRIVTPREILEGSVQVQDGIIRAVEPGKSRCPAATSLEGDYLLPGLVELHTDNLEKHFIPRPGVRWPDLAAVVAHDAAVASSGITTVLDALALGDSRENSDRIRELYAMARAVLDASARGLLRSEHLLHLRCEVGYPHLLPLLESFIGERQVKLVSLMDHTPGQRQFTRLDKFYQYYQGKFGLSQAEMLELIESRRKNQTEHSDRHRGEILRICREQGWPLASHDDTTREHVDEAAAAGVVVSEFPTTVEAAAYARERGMRILMGAPNLVLGKSHSGNVSALDLAGRELLDVLSSDYVPMSLLHGAFLLRRELDWPLAKAVRCISDIPAQTACLTDRGSIEEGKQADLLWVGEDGGYPLIRNVWRRGRRVC